MMPSICDTALTTCKVVGLTIVPANNYAPKTKDPCQSGGLHLLVHDIHIAPMAMLLGDIAPA